MKALDMKELYNIPARMEDIPLYVKKEDISLSDIDKKILTIDDMLKEMK